MIYAALGGIGAQVEMHELAGSVLPVRVEVLNFSLFGEVDSWGGYLELAAVDLMRNGLIINEAVQSSQGMGTVVLTATVSHAEKLYSLAKERGAKALLLHGQLGKKKREAGMSAAADYPLIFGTLSLLSEGIDWPHVGAVIFAAPVSAAVDKAVPSATRLIQSIGRARRPFPGKVRACVIDIVDQNGFGRAAFKKRLEIYAQQGFTVIYRENDYSDSFREECEYEYEYDD